VLTVIERECNSEFKMFGIYTKLALLGIVFTLLMTHQITVTAYRSETKMLPEVKTTNRSLKKAQI
jgi:hypothetical protein